MQTNAKRNMAISAIIILFYLASGIYGAINDIPVRPNFYAIAVVMMAACMLLLRNMRSWQYIFLCVNLFMANYLGSIQYFYGKVEGYDLAMHFVSHISLVMVAYYLLHDVLLPRQPQAVVPQWLIILLCVLFSIAFTALWEIYEFVMDRIIVDLYAQGSGQPGLVDTMTDMIAGTTGALFAGGLLIIAWRVKQKRTDTV
ncbi:hypothetical protein LJC55_01830 [Eubacteriales bacterium OttesenSCG-928-N14]|nr:hypothetical protein [Eubacteriales bacterium OttesenSCG-928-N14]